MKTKFKWTRAKKVSAVLFVCTIISITLCFALKSWLFAVLSTAFAVVTKLVIDGDVERELFIKYNEPFPKEQRKAIENARKSKEKLGV